MTRRAVQILVAIGMAVTTLLAASPAQAALKKKAVAMRFTASPASVDSGAVVTLAGRAWAGKKGNAGRVDLYFHKRGAAAWTFVGSTRAARDGTFRRTVRASATGTFRAVYRGNAKRKAAIRHDDLVVRVPAPAAPTSPAPPKPPADEPPAVEEPLVVKQPVTITLDGVLSETNSFGSLVKGTPLTVTGTAVADSTGNAAVIDVYRRTVRNTYPMEYVHTKVTSTHADDDGRFAFTIEATAKSTYTIEYRGNPHRQGATARFGFSVYEYLPTGPGELLSVRGDGYFATPESFTVEPGPLWLDWTATGCSEATKGGSFGVAFFDPQAAPRNIFHGPGQFYIPYMGLQYPSHVDLAPDITTGRFHVAGCNWTITISQ